MTQQQINKMVAEVVGTLEHGSRVMLHELADLVSERCDVTVEQLGTAVKALMGNSVEFYRSDDPSEFNSAVVQAWTVMVAGNPRHLIRVR